MFSTQNFPLVNEVVKRALETMNKYHDNKYHFCDCEDLFISYVVLFDDEHIALQRMDSVLLKVSSTMNKIHPVQDQIRMGHLGQDVNNRYGFSIFCNQ